MGTHRVLFFFLFQIQTQELLTVILCAFPDPTVPRGPRVDALPGTGESVPPQGAPRCCCLPSRFGLPWWVRVVGWLCFNVRLHSFSNAGRLSGNEFFLLRQSCWGRCPLLLGECVPCPGYFHLTSYTCQRSLSVRCVPFFFF